MRDKEVESRKKDLWVKIMFRVLLEGRLKKGLPIIETVEY